MFMSLNRSARVVIVVPVVAAITLVVSLWDTPWTGAKILGLALLIPGIPLLTIARLNLGNAFSVAPRATILVNTGLYSRIRNPIYVFGTFAFAGFILYMNQPWFMLALLPLIGMQVWRARAESRVLEAKFGDEYRRYRMQTWF
jgi:protein-S-isoprenylcysteine O-methyltransferase Ste14